ncbi:MAG: hypothetical protein LBG65_04710 [Puniceicoccales bacterium]|nr:hypothetical protein [Puniceicoccales bacterium]
MHANGNYIYIADGISGDFGFLIGGQSAKESSFNTITINGGTTIDYLYGSTETKVSNDNIIDIPGGHATINCIFGGDAQYPEGESLRNFVDIKSAYSGEIGTIIGGNATRTSSDNRVNITGGLILGSVLGGTGDRAVYNTIRIGYAAQFGPQAQLFGGQGYVDSFSGNTLEKRNDVLISCDARVGGNYGVQNFEYLKFYYDGAANIASLNTTVRRPTEGIVKIDTDPENNGTGHVITFDGFIKGAGGLQKVGAGKLILSGQTEYTGALSVVGGTVVLDGVNQSATSVSVATGATLAGTGTANASGEVTLAGTISPGVNAGAIGKLTFRSGAGFVIKSTAILSIDLDAVAGADVVENFGDIKIEPGAQLLLADIGGQIQAGDEFTVLSAVGGAISGDFVQGEFEIQGISFQLVKQPHVGGGGGEDLLLISSRDITYATPAVPEPSVYALCGGLAALSLAAFRRHRKNRRRAAPGQAWPR